MLELSLWRVLAKIQNFYDTCQIANLVLNEDGNLTDMSDLDFKQIKELRDMGLIYANMVTSTEGLFYLYMLTNAGKEAVKDNQPCLF